RPHHFDTISISIGDEPENIVPKIEQGTVDGTDDVPTDRLAGLVRRYGANKRQFRTVPGAAVFSVYLNGSRALLRGNLTLRRAINFALDRPALLRALGAYFGRTTDQYLPPKMPGYRNVRVYPVDHPQLQRARSLAHGHLRSGRATMFVSTPRFGLAQI